MNNTSDMYYPSQASGPMGHYSSAQPAMLHSYNSYSNGASYGGNSGYCNGLASPPSVPSSATILPSTQNNVLPLPGVQSGPLPPGYAGFDTSGQVAPPGMKPRVTATLWEDEASLCFQVETKGICVARREGESLNDMQSS